MFQRSILFYPMKAVSVQLRKKGKNMRANRKQFTIHDGKVTDILRSETSTQVELENSYYDGKKKEKVNEPVTLRLDNPAQAEGLEKGTRVAIFRDAAGHSNLVREGEWKSGGPVMIASKSHPERQYDNGVTVIMGKVTSAAQRVSKDKGTPYFSMNIVTADHTQHHISVFNHDDDYNRNNIEEAVKRVQPFLANDEHDFIPFTGTFVTSNARSEGEHEYNGQTYTDRNYVGLLACGGYDELIKVEQKDYSKDGQSQDKAQDVPQTSQDMNASLDAPEVDADGFSSLADMDEGEEMPFS